MSEFVLPDMACRKMRAARSIWHTVCIYGAAMTHLGWQEGAEHICAGHIDLVLIQNLFRFSRRKQEAYNFLHPLHQHNVALFSAPPSRKSTK